MFQLSQIILYIELTYSTKLMLVVLVFLLHRFKKIEEEEEERIILIEKEGLLYWPMEVSLFLDTQVWIASIFLFYKVYSVVY